jgi:hypothetical protein
MVTEAGRGANAGPGPVLSLQRMIVYHVQSRNYQVMNYAGTRSISQLPAKRRKSPATEVDAPQVPPVRSRSKGNADASDQLQLPSTTPLILGTAQLFQTHGAEVMNYMLILYRRPRGRSTFTRISSILQGDAAARPDGSARRRPLGVRAEPAGAERQWLMRAWRTRTNAGDAVLVAAMVAVVAAAALIWGPAKVSGYVARRGRRSSKPRATSEIADCVPSPITCAESGRTRVRSAACPDT